MFKTIFKQKILYLNFNFTFNYNLFFMSVFYSFLIVFLIVVLFFKDKRTKKLKKIIEEQKKEVSDLRTELNSLRNENLTLKEDFEKEKVLANLVRQSPNAIMLMDDDGNILWINKGFTRMYEYSFAEFIKSLGKNYRQTSFSPNVEERIKYIKRTLQPFRYEALNITKTGKQLWTQTALVPIVNENNEIINMVTIDTDIHQRISKSDALIDEMEKICNRIDDFNAEYKKVQKELNHLFNIINEMYRQISTTDQIIHFIKEVSDRTKILGINASIEAYAAGEHGKGFRVIANEMVDISNKIINGISEIQQILVSINSTQNELIFKKEKTANIISDYQLLFEQLKKDIRALETSIEEFKSIA